VAQVVEPSRYKFPRSIHSIIKKVVYY
jgi:hypothetical protein